MMNLKRDMYVSIVIKPVKPVMMQKIVVHVYLDIGAVIASITAMRLTVKMTV